MRFPPVIFLAMENWDGVWRRFQPLAASMASRYPLTPFLFVGLPRDFSHAVRKRSFNDLRATAFGRSAECPNLSVIRPWKLLPNTLPLFRKVNECIYRVTIRVAMRRLKIADPVVWINPHWAEHVVGRLGEAASVYDLGDDWTAFNQSPAVERRVRRQDAELCQKADAIVVVSERLFQLKQAAGKPVRLIPNGVNLAMFRGNGSTHCANGGAAERMGRCRKPVLGYVGTIHPDRVDVALLRSVAERWHGSIVLLGPDYLSREDRDLLRLPNIHFLGAVKYSEVPDYISAIDVCITPHRVSPFTESLNPLKLWEYLAAGKPIVSTDVAGFRDYPQFVRIATRPDEFISAALQCLSEDRSVGEARREEASRHSWESRLDAVEAVIAAVVGKASPGQGLPAQNSDGCP